MEQLLKYFDWVALTMASVGTSLALAVINQTQTGEKIHNGWIALLLSAVFSVLLVNWDGFLLEWQSIIFQFLLTVMVACLIGISRGQDLVDGFITMLLSKTGIKKENLPPEGKP